MDPVAVIQHVQGVGRHAHSAISEARAELSTTQRLADQALNFIVPEARSHASEAQVQARVQVQSIETRAQTIVSEMETNHQREIAQIQDVAQRAHGESQVGLSQMEDYNRELLAIIESQPQAMESQREEQQTLMHQVGILQSEITMLIQYQDQNGAVDAQGLMQIMNSLKDEIKVMKGHQVRKKSHERHEESKVAAAPYQGQSACAGYPHPRIPVQHIRCTLISQRVPQSQFRDHSGFHSLQDVV